MTANEDTTTITARVQLGTRVLAQEAARQQGKRLSPWVADVVREAALRELAQGATQTKIDAVLQEVNGA